MWCMHKEQLVKHAKVSTTFCALWSITVSEEAHKEDVKIFLTVDEVKIYLRLTPTYTFWAQSWGYH